MKKLFLLYISLIITGLALQAQNALISGTCFGGSRNDGANNLQLTPDGGYIFAGYTSSSDGNVVGYHGDDVHNEIWVVKADSAGNIQWQNCLGGTDGDMASQILLTDDGGYLVIGSTASGNGNVTQHFGGYDAWIVKLNSAGTLTWQKSYGGSGNDYAYGAAINLYGHYVIAGTTSSNDSGITNIGISNAWVFEIDSVGNLVRQHTYGGTGYDAFNTVLITDSSGNYYFFGSTTSSDSNMINHGGSDFWTVETDGDSIIQQACFGGDSDEYLYNAFIDSGGTFILVGGTYSYNNGQVLGSFGGEDAWVLQVDTFFDFVSQAVVGGSDNDYFTGVAENNGQLILVGTTYSNDGNFAGLNHGGADICLVQMEDYSGPLTSVNCYGGTLDDLGNSVAADTLGYIYVCGAVASYNGNIAGNHGDQDAWVGVTYENLTGITEISKPALQAVVFPNPSDGNFEVQVNSPGTFTGTLELLNILGETVASQPITVNNGMNTFNSPSNSAQLAAGIYFLRIMDSNGIGVVSKVVAE